MEEFERKLIEDVIKGIIIRRNGYYCDLSYIKILYYLRSNEGVYVIYNNINDSWIDRDEYNRKKSAFYYMKEYLSWTTIMSNINFDSLFYKKQRYGTFYKEEKKKKRFKKLFKLNAIENF